MIYKDKYAHQDTEEFPCARTGEICLNCGEECKNHLAWRCILKERPSDRHLFRPDNSKFHCIVPEYRYLTQSMKDSITPVPAPLVPTSPPPKLTCIGWVDISADLKKALDDLRVEYSKMIQPAVSKDISDWRAWAHTEPGHCPCGIARAQCTYHKG